MAIVSLKKLKLILLYSFFFLSCCYVFLTITNTKDKEIEQPITGSATIKQYQIDGDTLKLVLSSKNQYIGFYQIKDKTEKTKLENTLQYEDKITFIGKLELPTTNTNMYQFSYRNYLKGNGIYFQIQIEKINKVTHVKTLKSILKNGIQNRIHKIDINDRYLSAFLLGEKSNLDDIYFELGVSHLFCISGMHFSFFLSFFFYFLPNRRKAKLLSLPFLIFYAWMIGFSISIIRVLGCLIFSILPISPKSFSLHEFLILLSGVLLLWNPYLIYQPGFLYSFIISDALILSKDYLKRFSGLRKIGFVSFISFLASIPITLMMQYECNLLSILFNVIYVPFVSYVLFPSSFLVFLLPFLYPIYHCFLLFLEFINQCCFQISICKVVFGAPSISFTFIYFLTFYISFLRHHHIKYLLLLLMILKGMSYLPRNELVMFDVGQGDSFLVVSDKTVLIDTGGKVSFQKEAWRKKKNAKTDATKIIIPYLKAIGRTKIDLLILTHGDMDHIGNAMELLKNFKVRQIVMNCGNDNPKEMELKKYAKKKNISVTPISTGDVSYGKIKFAFLNEKADSDENRDSLVFLLKIKNRNLLFTGDAEEIEEKKILDTYFLPNVDILKVGHHGSKNGTTNELLNTIKPDMCLISAGKHNRYHHPHSETRNRIRSNNCKCYVTKELGMVRILLDSKKVVTLGTLMH